MTTDNFTEAAAAAAEEQWTRDLAPGQPLRGPRRMDRRIGFTMGAAWARTHLAAQEPTDAEVEAAQAEVVLHAPDFTKPGVIRCHCGTPGLWSTPDAHEQHALWHALRAARRDEEKR